MTNHSSNNKDRRLARTRVARAVFAAAEAIGLEDRELIEQFTNQVIQRLEQTQPRIAPALPGMEDLLQKSSDGDGATMEQIRGVVEEVMKEAEKTKKGQPAKEERASALTSARPRREPSAERSVEPLSPRAITAPEAQLSPNAMTVLDRRYLKKDSEGRVTETVDDMFRRVAANIATIDRLHDPEVNAEAMAEEFYQMMVNLEFLPNSPTLMNAGRDLQQLSACFVLPIDDSIDSIFDAIKYTAIIHKSGGGTGFSFSRIRPQNDRVKTTGGIASGPLSFLKVFDSATDAVKQGGTRRGANMAILRVDHPDIMSFITSKENESALNNFNISVAVTEAFMKAVEAGADYDLINPRTGKAMGKLNAKMVFDKIVECAWRNGDPGIVFMDRINRDNPTPQLGEIESTNPCGEQPLLPYESCNLGSINLSQMVKEKDGVATIDYDKLDATIRKAVHFLDNVIDANHFPLPQIDKMTKANRKIGLGVMGFADMLIQLGIPYDSELALETGEKVMAFINQKATEASAELAEGRGVFPAFKGSIYDRPDGPQVRNSTRTTIAPTGTLSIIANCSSGIEPLFALSYVRHILDDDRLAEVHPFFEAVAKREGFYSEELMKTLAVRGSVRGLEGIPQWVQNLFPTAHDIAPEWHVRMQAAFQRHTDNAVSKTVNFPQHATVEDVARVYMLAFKEGCKGITIYRDASRDKQVLSTAKKSKAEAQIETKIMPRERPRTTTGTTHKVSTGCGNLYITVNRDEQGIAEVFSHLGKAGGCASAQSEATSRLISLALRSGVELESVVEQLRGIRCPSIAWDEGRSILSCPDAIGSVLERHLKASPEPERGAETKAKYNPGPKPVAKDNGQSAVEGPVLSYAEGPVRNLAGQCPECSSLLVYQEGCYVCRACGYTKCG